ncbi:hypothetical protein GCM10023307_33190 [Lysobacter hankyongensis]|uniref:Uncharacterized protein n=1 Tax=Lysobacter hankyongensis TaxID=1176535 RepID=A0ABP9C1Y9_9GAMM
MAPVKPLPVMVTRVPPVVGPWVGEMAVIEALEPLLASCDMVCVLRRKGIRIAGWCSRVLFRRRMRDAVDPLSMRPMVQDVARAGQSGRRAQRSATCPSQITA